MRNLFLSLVCILVLTSCKKEKVVGPEGPAGANGTTPTGTITGKITQTDQFYTNYTTNLNNTTVSIDGTTITTVTSASGNYTLSNVPPGLYDISLIKNGCGLTKLQQINFPGNGTLYLNATIGDKATHTFNSATLTTNPQYISVQVNYPTTNFVKIGIIILGKTTGIFDLANPLSYDLAQNFYVVPSVTTQFDIYYSQLDSIAYPSGTTIYAKIYPTNSINSGYYDFAINKNIYTGYGTPLPTIFTIVRP